MTPHQIVCACSRDGGRRAGAGFLRTSQDDRKWEWGNSQGLFWGTSQEEVWVPPFAPATDCSTGLQSTAKKMDVIKGLFVACRHSEARYIAR